MTKAKDKDRIKKHVNIQNRRASFEFQFLDKYTAGIILKGTEIKSIREGKVNLQDGYCVLHNGELYLHNVHISTYTEGTHYNHEPMRVRKLLVNKSELKRLEKGVQEQGVTIIPTRMFISERGFAKVEVALARGKKLHDKREDIKAKDIKRELDRSGF
ncbi:MULTISPECIES: SsrA-binding protein SmpB [Pontibacter]|uniref:SsrA-binding protein n=1 Tax=Pontibacter lucknowensis TaxID=1077936 RepID=A0A1N7ARZ9_9BACT|nr:MULTISPECIES: SsrA-binding protein SmpB [Pontibacter]EJF10649.1 SsrA-binding protein [Pontibacter sp. BAB1700]SIR41909.1 SsrA-binding protein [Pontibacter lucknowensis]